LIVLPLIRDFSVGISFHSNFLSFTGCENQ